MWWRHVVSLGQGVWVPACAGTTTSCVARWVALMTNTRVETRDVFLCDPVRTPIGRYGGALAKVRTDDLAAVPIRALVDRHPHIKNMVHEVYLGCANQAGEDNRNVARMALLLAGLPETVPGVTLNRLCASGMEDR